MDGIGSGDKKKKPQRSPAKSAAKKPGIKVPKSPTGRKKFGSKVRKKYSPKGRARFSRARRSLTKRTPVPRLTDTEVGRKVLLANSSNAEDLGVKSGTLKRRFLRISEFTQVEWLYLYATVSDLREFVDNNEIVFVDGRMYPDDPKIVKKRNGLYSLTRKAEKNPKQYCISIISTSTNPIKSYNIKSSSLDNPYVKAVMIGDSPLSEEGLNSHLRKMGKNGGGGGRPPIFGVFLKELMDDRKITQEELAEKAEISDRTIRNMLSDPEYQPSVDTLVALCIALELDEMEEKTLFAAAGRVLRNTERDNALAYILQVNHAPIMNGFKKRTLTVDYCNAFLMNRKMKPLNDNKR